jgi:predicted permease
VSVVLETVLPVFALVFAGYFVGRRFISEEGIKGLTGFVYYFAIPALLFRTMGGGYLPGPEDLVLLAVYFGGCFIVFALSLASGYRLFTNTVPELGLMAMAGYFGNTVLLGIPLVLAAFGEAGMLPLTLIITFHSALLFPLTILVVELGRGAGSGGWRKALGDSFKALARNPVILAILAGLAYGATGWGLAKPIDAFINLLSGAAAPTALFALGASLSGYKIAGDLKEISLACTIKLLVHPLAVGLLGYLDFDLRADWAAIAVLTAALPAGANVFVLAQQYNIYLGRAASIVLISTGLSMVTLSILLSQLHAAG